MLAQIVTGFVLPRPPPLWYRILPMATDPDNRIRTSAQDDRHVPLFHFVSPDPKSVCFDPNGALFWKGRYHLFYILQDPRLKTGPEFWQAGHCWGHASSADLLHWTHHPVALAPDSSGPEAAIYSGCALINKEGVPTLVYHGYGTGTCVATAADDDLITWRKCPQNPVIREPRQAGDPGWGIYNVFDPHVWLEKDTYYAILGGRVKPDDIRDTAYLFTSRDLVRWKYLHPFYLPNPAWTDEGDDCACPDFFRLGDKHALLCISHAKGTRCYIGDYRGNRFLPETHQPMNWPGGCTFAPETLLDATGRRIMWAWAIDQRKDWWKDGIPCVMTLPRALSLDPGGILRMEPVAELASLRRDHKTFRNMQIAASSGTSLDGVGGQCLEILLEAEALPRSRFGVRLCVSPDGSEQTTIMFNASRGELLVDTSKSSLQDNGWRPYPMDFWRDGVVSKNFTAQVVPVQMKDGNRLLLHIFLDRSILEIFVNSGQCVTQRIYPSRDDSSGVVLFAEDNPVRIHRLDAWTMTAASP